MTSRLERTLLVYTGLFFAAQTLPVAAQVTSEATFEVVTIRPTPPATTNWRNEFIPGRMRFENRSVRDMIKYAYNLPSDSQVVGATGWIVSEHFDMVGTEDEELAQKLQTLPSLERSALMHELVKGILRDRYGLRVQQKKVVLPVLALVPAHDGLKVTATNPSDGRTFFGIVGPSGSLHARATSMDNLADRLTGIPEADGRLIVDRTGLTGKYDWTLRWSVGSMEAATGETEPLPPLFTALQEQLGLRLVPQKAEVDAVLIEHVERPSAN